MTGRQTVRQAIVLACRCGRVCAALWRFARAHSPKWLLPVLAVCLAVPGPADEVIVVLIVLVPVLRSREARRELRAGVRDAWHGRLIPSIHA